jgi:hypothetical protein
VATSVTADNTATPLLPNSREIFTFDGAATTIATYASATAGPLSALIFDGAGWHDSADLVMPENIMPIILPPYSPKLNPVENAWEHTYDRRGVLRRMEQPHSRARPHRLHPCKNLGKSVITYGDWCRTFTVSFPDS